MATIDCAISGIRFATTDLNGIHIPHTAGYFHPVFALPHNALYALYRQHCTGSLLPQDSYLTFLAILHSTGAIKWKHPLTLNPKSEATQALVQNNIRQLVTVIQQSDCIKHPSFHQPKLVINSHNSDLSSIKGWIVTWNDNIDSFKRGRANEQALNTLARVEKKLEWFILSDLPTRQYAHIVADWADKAGEFPAHKDEEYKQIIRSCFNTTKMFNTPLAKLKEVKDYCECNIEAGSIHFHSLMEVLKEGIFRHVDYLGGSSLALGYTLLPSLEGTQIGEAAAKQEASIAAVVATAPTATPKREDYSSSLDFIKAKLAFRVKSIADKEAALEASKVGGYIL